MSDQSRQVDYTLDNLTLLKLIVIVCGKYIASKHQYILELPDSIPRFLQEWKLEFDYIVDEHHHRRYRLRLSKLDPKRWKPRKTNTYDNKDFYGVV